MFELLPPTSIPDHSILSATFKMSFYDMGNNYENKNKAKGSQNSTHAKIKPNKPMKKNLSKMNNNFFMSQKRLIRFQQQYLS